MSLPHLILGLLNYGPMSGYDLDKAFRASVWHFWTTEQSQIYRALYKLHEAELVQIEPVRQETLPDKKLYHLTAAGRAELQRWLGTPQHLSPLHEGWLGQVFFGAELGPAHLSSLLEARIAHLRRMIARFETDIPASAAHYAEVYGTPQEQAYWLLTADYGSQRLRFELHWAETALRRLEAIAGSSADHPE